MGNSCKHETSPRWKRTGIVGIVQFGDAFNLAVLDRGALFIQLRLSFELHPVEDTLHNPTIGGLKMTKRDETLDETRLVRR